ncbi:MAG TPA: glucosyl-3-phosphoglycerate synthase [Anaerolineales bacterium]
MPERRRRAAPRRPRAGHRILVPVLPGQDSREFLNLARILRDRRPIMVLGIVPVEGDLSLSHGAQEAQELRTRLRRLAADTGARLWPRIRVTHFPDRIVADFARENGADLVLLPWPATGPSRSWAEAIWGAVDCAAALVSRWPPAGEGELLLPVLPGRETEPALRIALNLAKAERSSIAALETPAPDGSTDPETAALRDILGQLPEVRRETLPGDGALHKLLERARSARVIVVGAERPSGDSPPAIDALGRRMLDDAPATVLARGRRLPTTPPPEVRSLDTISVLVDRWFAENTFHASEFEALDRLLARKLKQNLTISLALPALNEEKTVGRVLRTLKRELMENVPLLDELVLIDSNSSDRTRQIARRAGVPVYIHQEILPRHGERPGKGEALWKSLSVTSGDLVLWIDSDIVNIHPRFVYGLIGPLLLRPDLVFVKGFYRRPIRVGGALQAGGGGRVTELVARPLLNLFYPSLSGMIQPLAGEYGGRRSALEQVPFASGYGVEIGLLIDLAERFGIGALGQVDLVDRVHHNQPLAALSLMAFEILETVVRRLDLRAGTRMLQEANRSMKVIRHEAARYFLEVAEIPERERPPMISIPEYKARPAKAAGV